MTLALILFLSRCYYRRVQAARRRLGLDADAPTPEAVPAEIAHVVA